MWLTSTSTRVKLERAEMNDFSDYETTTNEILFVENGVAKIRVEGILTEHASPLAQFVGSTNTTYTDLLKALQYVASSEKVRGYEVFIDSPGGHFDGLFDVIDAMQTISKPCTAYVGHQAASAAYAIACQADKIIATSRTSRVGSVGVVASYYIDDEVVDITSTNAPAKRPDVKTEEGKNIVRKELDAMHDIFVEAIARGRKTSMKDVNLAYGQGAMFLAEEAEKIGMIDAIQTKKKTGIKKMDLSTLKAEHAALVDQIVAEERDRVSAHLKMAEASGDMKTAIQAITDGSGMTASLQAAYMAAGLNKRDQAFRNADETSLAVADSCKEKVEESDKVASLVEQRLGV